MKDVDLNLQQAGGVARFETGTTDVLLMTYTAAWSFKLAAWPPGSKPLGPVTPKQLYYNVKKETAIHQGGAHAETE